MARDYDAVIGGFAIMDGEVKFNSATFNINNYRQGVSDQDRALSDTEKDMIKGVVAIWTEGGCRPLDMTVK